MPKEKEFEYFVHDDTGLKWEDLTEEEKSGFIEGTPYSKKIEVIDYKDMTEENQQNDEIQYGIVKKVTVTVSYKDGAKTEEISLSAIVTRGNGA